MHPGDVAELVESEFERLSEEIADAPELRVKDLVLKPGPSIAIKFSKTDRPRLQMMVPTSLLGPAENPFGKVFEGGRLAGYQVLFNRHFAGNHNIAAAAI